MVRPAEVRYGDWVDLLCGLVRAERARDDHVAERVFHVVVLAGVEFVLEAVDLILEPVLLPVERGLVGSHRGAHGELRDDHRDGQPVQELRDGAVSVGAVAQPDQACHDDHRRTAMVTTGPSSARR